MSAHEKRGRARERLRAAQAGARNVPPEPRGKGPAAGEPPTAARHPGEWPEHHTAARTEGLELSEVLGTGRGTRTWLAKEQHSREKFSVTFCTALDAGQREAQQRVLGLVARHWAGCTHEHLVPVRALLTGDELAPALVTDHVAATSLATLTVQDGRLSPARLTPVLVAVAKALAALHERGWVHGTLTAQRVLLAGDRQVWVDGYGAPYRDAPETPPASWGHDDRPELADRMLARTPPEDVKALATLAWHALTGRYPGSDAHRVPLTLVCPVAPRGLVLVLEAALQDDPGRRPTAREFAAGAAALPAPPAGDPGPPTQILRADGSVETLKAHRRPPRRTPEMVRALRYEEAGRFTALTAALRHPGFRWPAAGLAGAAILLTAAWTGWSHVATLAGPTAPSGERAPVPSESAAAPAPSLRGTRAGPERPSPAVTGPRAPGSPAPSGSAGRPTPPAGPSDAAGAARAPERDAEEAVRELVTRRVRALSRGDEAALASVYLPDSGLLGQDRETMARALGQKGPGTEYSALSGVSMEVDVIHPVAATGVAEGHPRAGPGQTRRFYAEVLTRGWHGELPEGSHVHREGTGVRQSLTITAARTPEGWRLADVVPVAAEK